jgi:hypothetical protein
MPRVEMAREGVPLIVIQRQLGHNDARSDTAQSDVRSVAGQR